MGEIKEKLIKENENKAANALEEIKTDDIEKKELEARLKVEEKVLSELDGSEDKAMRLQIEANISMLQDLITIEENKINEATSEIKILNLRIPILRRPTWLF